MEDLYKNQLVSSYPNYAEIFAQVNEWDKEHQKLFKQQMQALLGDNLAQNAPPADASQISHDFTEIYNQYLERNRDANLLKLGKLADNAASTAEFLEGYATIQQNAANFIANQAEKMQTRHGQLLDEYRQKEAGIKQYIWATVGDDRVRSSHAERNGKMFSWDDSPKPGEEFGCRCVALPASVFENPDDASGRAEPVYPELLLPVFRAAGLVRNLFRKPPKPKDIRTNHGITRASQREITEAEISEAIRSAEKTGNIINKVGKYGTPQQHYIGSNGITVIKETAGRNAGKIITLWRRAPK